VLITIVAGTFLARVPDAAWFRAAVRRRAARPGVAARP
jgi:CPA2 family monovalent cation:H+ antiporter-2